MSNNQGNQNWYSQHKSNNRWKDPCRKDILKQREEKEKIRGNVIDYWYLQSNMSLLYLNVRFHIFKVFQKISLWMDKCFHLWYLCHHWCQLWCWMIRPMKVFLLWTNKTRWLVLLLWTARAYRVFRKELEIWSEDVIST